MPQKDTIHDAVRNALEKDGWTITADPLLITYDDVNGFIDLGAERTLAAEKGGRRIAVEIKSFQRPSPVRDFEEALGQYTFYRDLIALANSNYALYLAVSDTAYRRVFQRKAFQAIAERNRIALIAVNLAREEIVSWKEPPVIES